MSYLLVYPLFPTLLATMLIARLLFRLVVQTCSKALCGVPSAFVALVCSPRGSLALLPPSYQCDQRKYKMKVLREAAPPPDSQGIFARQIFTNFFRLLFHTPTQQLQNRKSKTKIISSVGFSSRIFPLPCGFGSFLKNQPPSEELKIQISGSE